MNRNGNLNFEKKTIYEIYRACRLCGAGGGYKMPIYNVTALEVSDVELKQKIQECVQIEVHSEDRMPPLICEFCVDKVHDFYEFLQLCQQTNRRTRLQLGLPLQKVPVQTLDARESILGTAPDSGDDEPLAKGKKTKAKVEKEVKAKVEDATPRESRTPARKDKPSSCSAGSKSTLPSRSPSASFGESPREAPKRTTRNSEDAAFKTAREMDSPSPPPNKRATRNSYETDSAFRPSSKTERNTKTLPKDAVRPTRGIIKLNKTDEAPEFLKPSPKCNKTPVEPAPRTTKKPPEMPAPKYKIPTETAAPKSKKPTETAAPKSKKPKETVAPKSKKPPESPAPKSKKPETVAPKTIKAPESTLPKAAKKKIETETPPPKPSRKRPPENEAQIPTPKKIKLPPAPAPPAPAPAPPAPPAPLFPCPLCGAGFASPQALSNHTRHHVPNYTPLKLACNACALWFVSSEESSAHHRTHRGTSAYGCARCGQGYKTHAAFNDHLITCLTYTEVPDLKCDACWRLFPTERLMAQHRCLGEDNRPGGKCSKCNRSYALLKNLSKHESTCQHRKKGDAIVDPAVMARIQPIYVRVAKCDPLLKMAASGSYDASQVVGKYGLDKTCFYPYGLHFKSEPDGMVSITDELLDFVHWDSDCSDSSDDSDSAEASAKRKNPENLSTLTLKVLFSKKYIGKVPKKFRKKLVKDEDAFDADVDGDIKNDIGNVIDNLGSWNDNEDDIFNIREKTVEASDDLDFDNIFDSLQNHDEDVRDEPKSSDSNEVSILKAVGYETPEAANADKRDVLHKEIKRSTLVRNGLENIEMGGSVEERLEKVKEHSDLVTENCLGKGDKALGLAAVPEEILDRVEDYSDLVVTENLDKVDKDLETRSEEFKKSMNDINKTVESPLTRRTNASKINNGSHTFRDDGSSVTKKDLESGDKILESKQLEKSPDKSFTQFCINTIVNSISIFGSNERNNLNTDTINAVDSTIQTDLDDNLDVSKDTDYAMKESDNTTSNNLCAENEDLDVSAKQNGMTTEVTSEKQLLDALGQQINETLDQCHMLGVTTAVIDINDENSKPEDSCKMVDSKTNNSVMKSMDLDNISDEELDLDS